MLNGLAVQLQIIAIATEDYLAFHILGDIIIRSTFAEPQNLAFSLSRSKVISRNSPIVAAICVGVREHLAFWGSDL